MPRTGTFLFIFQLFGGGPPEQLKDKEECPPNYLLALGLVVALAGCDEGASTRSVGPVEPWSVERLGSDARFRDVFFLDAHRGWIVGGGPGIDGGIVGSTEDGGRSWTFRSGIVAAKYRPGGFYLYAVHFVDERRGHATADGGRILRTVDGGRHWHVVGRVGGHRQLQDLHFVDALHGFAAAGRRVIRTDDGGETWYPASREGAPRDGLHLRAVHFIDPYRGWTVGERAQIYRTNDGGATWTHIGWPPQPGMPDLWGVHFLDPYLGWAVGERGAIFHTLDGGETWRRQPNELKLDLTDVLFVDEWTGWAIGHDGYRGASTVLHTSDGGETWAAEGVAEGQQLKALFAVDARSAWAVGERVREGRQTFLRYDAP